MLHTGVTRREEGIRKSKSANAFEFSTFFFPSAKRQQQVNPSQETNTDFC